MECRGIQGLTQEPSSSVWFLNPEFVTCNPCGHPQQYLLSLGLKAYIGGMEERAAQPNS